MEYFIQIYWSEQDSCYLAEVPDLPGCIADGMMEAEARQNAKESAERWIEAAKYFGREFPVPPPDPQEAEAFIGTRRLSDRDRDAFLALLDADPEPKEALKKRRRNTIKVIMLETSTIFSFRRPTPMHLFRMKISLCGF